MFKWANLFGKKKISTMIGRFYTGKDYIENMLPKNYYDIHNIDHKDNQNIQYFSM